MWRRLDSKFWYYGKMGTERFPYVVLGDGVYYALFMGVRRGFDNLSDAQDYALMGVDRLWCVCDK